MEPECPAMSTDGRVTSNIPVHFGGPAQPARKLRDLLEERIEAVPAGGEIDWCAYYFRDRALAHALVRAHKRGVAVRTVIDGRPRIAQANEAVSGILASPDGIGGGFRAVCPRRAMRAFGLRSRMHSKVYCFSHPEPAAFIGSFNPSGDDPEDPKIIAKIGDQDRGHNMLVEMKVQDLALELRRYVRRIHAARYFGFWRWRPSANRVAGQGGLKVYFFPRLSCNIITNQIKQLDSRSRLRIAMSHIKQRGVLNALAQASARGAEISIITHDTERRAPDAVLRFLLSAGIEVRRYCDPEGLPMHDKFLIFEQGSRKRVFFGSLNLNGQSQFRNHEILACGENSNLGVLKN